MADDELKSKNQWLVDFFKVDLVEAKASWLSTNPRDLNKEETKKTTFEFKSKVYTVFYEVVYSEDWDTLTKNGTIDPPKLKKSHPNSQVDNWTNYNGKGTYRETYSRKVPNWFVFKGLDTMVSSLTTVDVDPSLSALFWSDEQKYIRKLYRKNKMESAEIWKQFTYTEKKRIAGVNTAYLKNRGTIRKSSKRRKFNVEIINENGDVVEVTPFLSGRTSLVMDGIQFTAKNKSCLIFNFELNERFHRFAPNIFRDPDVVLLNFLLNLQKHSGKKLDRLYEMDISK